VNSQWKRDSETRNVALRHTLIYGLMISAVSTKLEVIYSNYSTESKFT